VTTAVAPSPQFTALDRCDRCGARAYVRVELASGGELLFCAHHAREHAAKIQQVASTIQDDSGTLAAILEELAAQPTAVETDGETSEGPDSGNDQESSPTAS
jgi:hypothetical protein